MARLTPAQRVEKVTHEISGVKAQYGITSWEDTFLTSVARQNALTVLQEQNLRKIEVKVFGADYDSQTGDLFA